MQIFPEIQKSSGRISVELQALAMGPDLNIAITGGDRPHLGAVAISSAAQGAANHGIGYSAVTVPLPGHREDILARWAALALSEQLSLNCIVACGIHVDGITGDEIEEVTKLVHELVATFIESYQI